MMPQTVAETFLIGVVSSFFNTTVLLLMLSAVAVASLSLMAFAVQVRARRALARKSRVGDGSHKRIIPPCEACRRRS